MINDVLVNENDVKNIIGQVEPVPKTNPPSLPGRRIKIGG
jgi:hypothetical protein